MKKNILLASALFLLVSLSQNIFAQKDNKWHFSLTPTFGARIGQHKEIVWTNKKSNGETYKLSELVYDLMPAWHLGVAISAEKKRFALRFMSKFFLAAKSGILTDSDWQNDDKFSNGDTSTKTNYSTHTLLLDSCMNSGFAGYDLELQSDLKFKPVSFLTLRPLLSVNAQYMKFSAKDGTTYYGKVIGNSYASYDDEKNVEITNLSGKVIDYDVYNFFLWTGIKAEFAPSQKVTLFLSTEISPVSFFLDFDHHIRTKNEYAEMALSYFYAFRQKIGAEFKLNDSIQFCQTATFVMNGESKGAMYQKNESEKKYTKQTKSEGGGQLLYVDIDFSLKFSW